MHDHLPSGSSVGLSFVRSFAAHRQTKASAHAGSRTRVTSMGGLYDAATLHALLGGGGGGGGNPGGLVVGGVPVVVQARFPSSGSLP